MTEDLDVKINVDTEELEDATEMIKDFEEHLTRVVPNITIRSNDNVYVTINNFNQTAKEYFDD